jgi:hypothetical protein
MLEERIKAAERKESQKLDMGRRWDAGGETS